MSTPPSAPSSLRWTKDGFNALLSLKATIKKARYLIVMDALIEKLNKTVAQAPLQCRLLPPSGILTLQAEVAKIEKRHADNRQKVMIRTSDKHATEKIIKAVEKIDSETSELQRLRWKLGVMAQLPESLNPENLESVNAMAAALEKTAIEMTNMTEMIAQLESERDQARTELAATIEQAATASAKITAGSAQLEAERDQARDEFAAAREKAAIDSAKSMEGIVRLEGERNEARAELAAALEQTAIDSAEIMERVAQLEAERDQVCAKLATAREKNADDSAKTAERVTQLVGERDQVRASLAAMIEKYAKIGKLVEVAESLTDKDQVHVRTIIMHLKDKIEGSRKTCPDHIEIFETGIKILTSL